MMPALNRSDELIQIRRMRLACVVEGATLLALVFVAVPLRHLGGHRIATTIMGPLHGMAFLLYAWMLIQTIAGGYCSKRDAVRMVIGAFVPFGAIASERLLRRRQAASAVSA